MKVFLKRLLLLALTIGISALLVFAFLEGRKALQAEREREMPVKIPPRLKKLSSGETLVTLEKEALKQAGITARRGSVTSNGHLIAPLSSLLRYEGRTFVYVEIATGEFMRKPVIVTSITDRGWEISGPSVDAAVVVTGSALLLSEELKSQIKVGD